MDPDPATLDLIFVYGTLRPAAPHSRHHLLQPAVLVGSGSLAGRLFNLEGYPGAVPVADEGLRVRGEVYRLLDPVEAIRRMDRYEGFVPEDPRDCEFRRERARVVLDSGVCFEVWIYYYNLAIDALMEIPAGDYVGFLQQQQQMAQQ